MAYSFPGIEKHYIKSHTKVKPRPDARPPEFKSQFHLYELVTLKKLFHLYNCRFLIGEAEGIESTPSEWVYDSKS